MEFQTWICPKCYDDHSQDADCKREDFLVAEFNRLTEKYAGLAKIHTEKLFAYDKLFLQYHTSLAEMTNSNKFAQDQENKIAELKAKYDEAITALEAAEQSTCRDCGVLTTPGVGQARCKECWKDKTGV